jgi:hypothetical protein
MFRDGRKSGWIKFAAGKCLTFTHPLYITSVFIQQ